MLIYVVKSGDSIWSIAQKYGVDYNSIIEANGLQNRKNLVVGEALVIPTGERSYRVKPGDSIWSIANKFNVPVESILALNNISNTQMLAPGMIIKIPDIAKNYSKIEVNGFIIPSNPAKETQVVNSAADYLTYITPFSYNVNEDGTLTTLNDEVIIKVAKAHRTVAMLCISNISEGGFNTELIGRILNNKALQQTLINNVVATINAKGFAGVIVDFERIPAEDRDNYNNFLRALVAKLHEQNYLVATALAPKTSGNQPGPWYEAHDYRAHGKIVDFVIIMTYEWGWSGGPPRAVAPINEVLKVLDYAVTVIPRNKIMMGVPFYGYDWTLPFVEGGKFAEAMGNQEAVERAEKYGAEIKYDFIAQTPYYNYYDNSGIEHVVWFEDARSMKAKYNVVKQYHLRGVSYWVLGNPFPQNWALISNMFEVKKLI